jgi:hypothetical protein
MKNGSLFKFLFLIIGFMVFSCNGGSSSNARNPSSAIPVEIPSDPEGTLESPGTPVILIENDPNAGALNLDTARDLAVSFVESINPQALELRPAEVVPAASSVASIGALVIPSSVQAASLRLFLNEERDIDSAEQKFTWDPAQEPLKESENFRCLVNLTEYPSVLLETIATRLNGEPDQADEDSGVYVFEAASTYEKSLKEDLIKKRCFSNTSGGSAGGTANGGSAGQDRVARFTISLATTVEVEINEEDNTATVNIGTITVKLWFDVSRGLGAKVPLALEPGESIPLTSYYGLVTLTELPSSSNPQGIGTIAYNAFEKIGEVEGAQSLNGRVDLTLDDEKPTRSFREARTDRFTWEQGEDIFGFENSFTQNAIIQYELRSEDATHENVYDGSAARTSSSWSWTPIHEDQGTTAPVDDDASGSYSVVWDAEAGRSITKWEAAAGAEEWWDISADPTAAQCRDTENLIANIYNYGVYTLDGDEINHRTYLEIITDKVDIWGWPIRGGIGTWGLWLNGVDDEESVYVDVEGQGELETFTYRVLPGEMRDQNYQAVIPTGDIVYSCITLCPKEYISDSADAKEDAIDPSVPLIYTYKVSDRKLYHPEGGAVTLAPELDYAWLTFSLTVVSGATVNDVHQWSMNRSRYTSTMLNYSNGLWFDAWLASDSGSNNITLNCTADCLKAQISQVELSTEAVTLSGAQCYVYLINDFDWSRNYKLYLDANCNQILDNGDDAVEFAPGVKSGSVEMSLIFESEDGEEVLSFNVNKSEYGASGGLVSANEQWLVAPKAVKFANFTIAEEHIYDGSPSDDALGLSTDHMDISYGQGFSDEGWGFGWVAWSDTGLDDAFGNNIWGPTVGFKKGVEVTPLNSTGPYVQGEAVQIAPKMIEVKGPLVEDCSEDQEDDVTNLSSTLSLPDDEELPFIDVRELIGLRPVIE